MAKWIFYIIVGLIVAAGRAYYDGKKEYPIFDVGECFLSGLFWPIAVVVAFVSFYSKFFFNLGRNKGK